MNNKYTYIEDREEDHDMVLATYRDTAKNVLGGQRNLVSLR